MKPSATERHKCSNCGKLVLVARVFPNRDAWLLSGIWLTSMDEDFRVHNVGWLCENCAFDLCHKGIVHLGFCGGNINDLDNWEAMKDKLLPSEVEAK